MSDYLVLIRQNCIRWRPQGQFSTLPKFAPSGGTETGTITPIDVGKRAISRLLPIVIGCSTFPDVIEGSQA
jgi:hypothetical protein